MPVLDTWWQTETGGIMIANYRSQPVRARLDGPAAARDRGGTARSATADGDIVVDRDGDPVEVDRPGASPANWRCAPAGRRCSAATSTRRSATARASSTAGTCTGDLARRDADGYYWFVGRADDVIKTAGHLIGPFEVESALIEHPAVVEAGVIGKPDPTAGAIVKAFVVLATGREPTDALRRELLGHARTRLGAAVAPREIEFVDDLPAHAQRQDHAPAAEGARTRPGRRRHVDARDGRRRHAH